MRLTLAVLLFWAATAAAQDTAITSPDSFPVEVGALIDGRDLPSYANAWWQWAYSMPQANSPVRDLTGSDCAINQEGPVWFLAGGFGSAKISRRCTIPPETYLFFPMINMLEFTPPNTDRSCQEVMRVVAANNETYVQLRATLNGHAFSELDQRRVASQVCFDPLGRVPPEFEPPSYAPAATDGYWLMLKPLPVGEHVLSFQAFYTNQGAAYGTMVQNISYDLTVSAATN